MNLAYVISYIYICILKIVMGKNKYDKGKDKRDREGGDERMDLIQ